MFFTCYIVDKGYGYHNRINQVKILHQDIKGYFIIILLFNFIVAIPMSIVLLATSSVRNILLLILFCHSQQVLILCSRG